MTAGAEEAAGVEAAGKGLAAWTYRPEEAEARVERAWTWPCGRV